tara:strand:+ start:2769 stop:3119 length:351 start_codon:yes stop_codon:yes gene_type:complete
MTSFDKLVSKYLGENIGGNTGVNNPTTSNTTTNVKFTASTAKPTQPGQQPAPQEEEEKDKQATTQPKPEEVLKALTDLGTHPDFLKVVQKAVDELQKKGQQQQFIAKQQNAAAPTY